MVQIIPILELHIKALTLLLMHPSPTRQQSGTINCSEAFGRPQPQTRTNPLNDGSDSPPLELLIFLSNFPEENGKATEVLLTIKLIQHYLVTPAKPIPEKAILIFPYVYGVKLDNTQYITDRLTDDTQVPT
ncbi:hypothetical protein KEM48_007749 [Puccinia striiformis f. sp. tritici PST-130]|uniref:Uncharacterized protein n=1 Tax=Puccinia striiformis f. sp. tritici PST-78 TaxID=1165861 RepID=A0A0L0V1H4_9BASI|nr:hypothetical protein H4Q26_008100 [Puccinia striiformis f. sp. tritici PST-130]KAI9621514.1 hypothetical protein KEM48_007749 [Puccinia striiformis f. sp. tritici PST-130]KNE93110.1 hypothetical protein PSTG_13499 [Puccinia striiformis f. sp. tritici PST-78]